ncbi:hypothetical protein [Terriglobus roseus]|uniref:hypothetical protein n=1 Tax=Terriglobus roseus TaxID=392734 RepID=UPI001114E569|nr:hypothetical protein [Terriglobus roseus]
MEQKLEGNDENIKERILGIALFGRDANYATGDDPVVRVQAKEVRRRLEAYRSDLPNDVEVLIDLPTGSYVPAFSLRESSPLNPLHDYAGIHPLVDVPDTHAATPGGRPVFDDEQTTPSEKPGGLNGNSGSSFVGHGGLSPLITTLVLVLVAALSIGFLAWMHSRNPYDGALRKFWGPILESPKPAVISLGRTIAYAPNESLYGEFRKSHPNAYRDRLDEYLDVLSFDKDATIHWSDLRPLVNIGPAFGGVRAGMRISSLMTGMRKPFVVRFGSESSFVELRDSPAIIVGSMNTRWTNSLEGGLHFAIHDLSSDQYVEEARSKRTWRAGPTSQGWVDYGLITREVVAPTGQFLVKFAGVGDAGTEAAGELLTNADLLSSAVKRLPRDWEHKNVQLLVEFNVIDGKAGPPKLVDTYVW